MGVEVAPTGLTVLSDPEDALADVVFVHGLGGHPRKTWTYFSSEPEAAKKSKRHRLFSHMRHGSDTEAQDADTDKLKKNETENGIFWPEDLLKVDFPRARIMTFGYNSAPSKGFHAANQGNIFSHSGDLLYAVVSMRNKEPSRPLIFIAHSLGGILVKEALKRSERVDPSEDVKRIYRYTKGIFFFGTPHRGSEKWASEGEAFASIAKILLGMDVNPQILHALQPSGGELASCREIFGLQWEARRTSLTVRTFYEGKGLTGIGFGGFNKLIVPRESAIMDHPAERARSLNANHIDMVKFSGKNSEGYMMVKGDLEALMMKPVDVDKTETFDEIPSQERHACLQTFRTSDYEQFKDRNPERLGNTCKWFLDHERFHKWKETQHSTILWVSADPGCGKSVLAKYLVDKEESLEVTASRAVCYFFFKEDSQDQNSLTTALLALLHQLFSQRPPLIRHAMKDFRTEGQKLITNSKKLWNILLEAASDPKAEEVVCILDGLDECEEKQRHNFIETLSKFYKQAIPGEIKSQLKFLITSRPYHDIERRFGDLIRNFPEIQLSGQNESEAISQEIDEVIRFKLEKLALDLTLKPEEKSTLEAGLLSNQREQRTYLWATLVFNNLYDEIHPTSRKIKEIVQSIPTTVENAYESILSKIQARFIPQARKLFSLVIAASRPLTLQELNVALAIETSHESYTQLQGDLDDESRFPATVKNIGGLFVSIKDQRVYLIHQTARRFLLAENKVLVGWAHSFDTVETELTIATTCIVFLMFDEFKGDISWDGAKDDIPSDEREALSEITYLDYASTFWMVHFRRAQSRAPEDLIQKVLEVSNHNSKTFNIWDYNYRRTSQFGLPRFISSIMVASYFGHHTILEQLLENIDDYADVDSTDNEYGRTSLTWAVQQGHLSVVKLLVENGKADVNSKDKDARTPLWLACNTHYEDIALFLLENSADAMYKTDRIQSPLFESASQGLPKVVGWVLKSLPDQGLESLTEQYDSGGKSILNLAIISDKGAQAQIVKLVLDALARFPEKKRALLYHQDNGSCSPLFHAAQHNRPEVIKLLVKGEKGLLSQAGWFEWRDSPLHVATHWQNPEAVQALVNAGANLDFRQRDGFTPLHIASHRTDSPYGLQILRLLLKRGNPLLKINNGENIIHLVLDHERPKNFKVMQECIPWGTLCELLTSKDNKGDIPILHATARLRHIAQDYSSHSATYKAVCEAFVEAISNSDANTILDLVRDTDRPNAIHKFIETDSDDLVAEIMPKIADLDRSFLDSRDDHGRTLLMKAVERQQRQAIQFLIEHSPDVNAQDDNGKTALHIAVERDIPGIAETLVKANASLVIKDNVGRIPVDWCSSRNSCRALVEPKDRPRTPNPVAGTSSTQSSRSEWLIVLGAPLGSCHFRLMGETDWYSRDIPTSVRECRYLVSESIPSNIKLPVSRIKVTAEGRDQGWSMDQWFGHIPEGAFTSTPFALGIMRNDQIVLQRQWARNPHRSKTPHKFECTWYSDSDRNRDVVEFGGREAAGPDDQGEFVRRLTVGDRVVLMALADGEGWMNIVKSAEIEIHFED